MNGIHDLGGMHGLGPINPETDEPVFHHDWQKRAFGMFLTTAAAAGYSVDEFRHAIENLSPTDYLETSYYEHWMHAFETVLSKRGLFTLDELESRVAQLKNEVH
jgi:nitrile hydratase